MEEKAPPSPPDLERLTDEQRAAVVEEWRKNRADLKWKPLEGRELAMKPGDLLHNVGGNYEYLNDSSGLIRTYQFHAPTGNVTAELVQQGELGVPALLHTYAYIACYCCSSSSS